MGYPQHSKLLLQDIAALEKSYITPKLAEQAMLFRVNSADGATLIGRNGQADYAGIVFPYYWPGDSTPREYRLRRDHPELEQKPDGTRKEKNKYLSPPGGANLLYFMPDTRPESLQDTSLNIAFTEGEKKVIALYRLAFHEVDGLQPCFLPIGLPGVWNWRGTIGKADDEKGARCDVKGPIPDLDRIEWSGRIAYIIFDSNVVTNSDVRAARRELAKELTRRGAQVRLVDLPQIEGINGLDDLLTGKGPEFVLSLISSSHKHDSEERSEVAHSYFQKNGRLVRFKPTRAGDIVVSLCNFIARIIGDITEDDSSTERRVYEIQGQLADRYSQATATVSAAFVSLGVKLKLG